jgi:flagellar hook protein FlgE
MSLYAALTSSVSALKAQSTQLAAVAQNIANASTTAYKTTEVSFQSLVTGNSDSSTNAAGSVVTSVSQNMDLQGEISTTDIDTNIAIDGSGFFVVSDGLDNTPSAYCYSRNGEFNTDADGYLINSEGYYLLGWQTDENGNVLATNSNDLNSLEVIDVSSITGSAEATSEVTFDLNLPADAVAGDAFVTSCEIYDSLGVSHTVEITWTKDAVANTWVATLADPYLTNDSTVTSGTIAPASITIAFDGNGKLSSYTTNAITISSFTTGANDSAITLDFGTIGSGDGITQYASSSSDADLEITLIDSDGVRYGQLSGITISEEGLVTASFDNGLSQVIYQIAIATFSNAEGLTHVDGTVYDENEAAGNYNLQLPGDGNAGSIVSSAVELSTTDTSTEFNKMIIAQQAYSSAAQVISTVNEMYDTLIISVR